MVNLSKKNLLVIIGLAVIFLSLPLALFLVQQKQIIRKQAAGNTYYVATNGDDANPGTLEKPWRTLQKAAATLQPGDTVLVRGGVYSGSVHPANHGREGAWITFKNYPGERPVLDAFAGDHQYVDAFYLGRWGDSVTDEGSYVEVNGFKIRNYPEAGVGCRNSHHIRVLNNIIEYSGVDNVDSTEKGCDYFTIEGNILRYSGRLGDGTDGKGWGSGISLNQKMGRDYDHDGQFHNFIRNNIIYGSIDRSEHRSEGSGIIIDLGGDVSPTLIEGNIIFNNGRTCVNVYNASNVWVIGNTCFKNCQDFGDCSEGWQSELTFEGHDEGTVVARGNLVYADKAHPLSASNGPAQADYNLYFGGRGIDGETGPNDIIDQNPQLLNTNINCWLDKTNWGNPQGICASDNPADFRAYFGLQAQSPAIDKIPESGATYQGPGQTEHIAQTDFDGLPRPQGAGYDIGAYEYTSGVVPTVPSSPSPTSAPGVLPPPGNVYIETNCPYCELTPPE